MEIERVTHYVDNVLTQAEARMGLRNTRLLVAWYTNQKNDQSVVHSHPYHELVLPIGGSTVRYSIDGSVYLVHVGELIYFPAQIYHAGIFNIDNDHSDRLVIQIDDALWQACRRNANLKNAAWMHSIRAAFEMDKKPPSKGFGGKDSVKENRQGCLSRPIKQLLSTF